MRPFPRPEQAAGAGYPGGIPRGRIGGYLPRRAMSAGGEGEGPGPDWGFPGSFTGKRTSARTTAVWKLSCFVFCSEWRPAWVGRPLCGKVVSLLPQNTLPPNYTQDRRRALRPVSICNLCFLAIISLWYPCDAFRLLRGAGREGVFVCVFCHLLWKRAYVGVAYLSPIH